MAATESHPTSGRPPGCQFTNVSVDAAGTVYAVYGDNHKISYSWSTNRGSTWSAPKRLNSGPAATALFPRSVAGAAGWLDVVWAGRRDGAWSYFARIRLFFASCVSSASPRASSSGGM